MFPEKNLGRSRSPFNNVAGLMAGNSIKRENPVQVFSCEY